MIILNLNLRKCLCAETMHLSALVVDKSVEKPSQTLVISVALVGVTGEGLATPGVEVGSGCDGAGAGVLLLDDAKLACFNFARKRCGLDVSLELRRRLTAACSLSKGDEGRR